MKAIEISLINWVKLNSKYLFVTIAILHLIACGSDKSNSWSEDDVYEANVFEVYDFYENLETPSNSDKISTIESFDFFSHVSEDPWLESVYVKPNSSYDYREYEPILKRDLIYEGKKVRELIDKRANGKIAILTCLEGEYAIIYAKKPDSRIIGPNFCFFREHEFAHLKLGHLTCTRTGASSPQNHQIEYEADCEAVKSLRLYGDAGRRVVDIAAGTLLGLGHPTSPRHPDSPSRGLKILKECN